MKNQVRQLARKQDNGKNKAKAAVERLDFAPNLTAIPSYLNEDRFREVFNSLKLNPTDIFLMVLAVDNDRTRQALIKTLDEVHQSYVIINPGNLYDTSMCSCFIKIEGRSRMTTLEGRYNNIANPSDEIPGGCGEQTPSTPQLITANMSAACMSLMTLSNILDDQPIPEEVNCDVRKLKVKTVGASIVIKAAQ